MADDTNLFSSLDDLVAVGREHGLFFYGLIQRRQGWAVKWLDPSPLQQQPTQSVAASERERLRRLAIADGLFVHSYHKTPEQAVLGELARLRGDMSKPAYETEHCDPRSTPVDRLL